VLPDQVAKLEKMNPWGILGKLSALDIDSGLSPTWIVLTGGNPALLNLSHLIDLLHARSQKVMLETQGSVFREWFGKVDDLCFSPKPPSSGMAWSFGDFDRILTRTIQMQCEWAEAQDRGSFPLPYLKVPIFTDEDLEFAAEVKNHWGNTCELFLSIGNNDPSLPTVGNPHPDLNMDWWATADLVLQNQRKWTERILEDQRFADVRIFSQQHVLLWGNARGY